jgi:hypothetical protein
MVLERFSVWAANSIPATGIALARMDPVERLYTVMVVLGLIAFAAILVWMRGDVGRTAVGRRGVGGRRCRARPKSAPHHSKACTAGRVDLDQG